MGMAAGAVLPHPRQHPVRDRLAGRADRRTAGRGAGAPAATRRGSRDAPTRRVEMRVLFLTHSFPRHPGDAAGSFVLRLPTALVDEGGSVRVVTPSASGLAAVEQMGPVEVHRFRYAPRVLETLAYTGNMASQVRDSWGARLALAGLLGAGLTATLWASRRFKPDPPPAPWWVPSARARG